MLTVTEITNGLAINSLFQYKQQEVPKKNSWTVMKSLTVQPLTVICIINGIKGLVKSLRH